MVVVVIETALSPDLDALRWRRARTAVHAWRGEMIDLFAQAEIEISEALLTVGCTSSELLVGKRTARLVAAIAPDGERALEGAAARGAVAAFQHDTLRHALCHSVAQIALDQEGHWIVILRMVRLRATGPERMTRVIDEAEAPALQQSVRKSVADLLGQLRRMRKVIAAPAPANT